MKAHPILLAALRLPAAPPPAAGSGRADRRPWARLAYANGLRVRPLQIIEDSRCPINVQSHGPGPAASDGDRASRRQLALQTRYLDLGKPLQVADGALTLVAAQPEKQAGAETDPRSYRFTFDFQGGLLGRTSTPRGSRRSPCPACGRIPRRSAGREGRTAARG